MQIKNKIKQFFCKHEVLKPIFYGTTMLNNEIAKVMIYKCQDCGKEVIHYKEKPSLELKEETRKTVNNYYAGTNPND